MAKKDDSAYIEDQAQIDVIGEFTPKIREILREYRAKRQLSSIAKQLGIHQSRLTEMITKNESI
jgi:DNA-binding MarR family transcriptional regulator